MLSPNLNFDRQVAAPGCVPGRSGGLEVSDYVTVVDSWH